MNDHGTFTDAELREIKLADATMQGEFSDGLSCLSLSASRELLFLLRVARIALERGVTLIPTHVHVARGYTSLNALDQSACELTARACFERVFELVDLKEDRPEQVRRRRSGPGPRSIPRSGIYGRSAPNAPTQPRRLRVHGAHQCHGNTQGRPRPARIDPGAIPVHS